MLNASKRKSKFVLSVIGNFFSAEESRLISSGPRSMFLPELPQLYAVGTEKAEGLNHSLTVLFEGYWGAPGTTLARLADAPVLVAVPLVVTVNGKPDCPKNSVQLPSSEEETIHDGVAVEIAFPGPNGSS